MKLKVIAQYSNGEPCDLTLSRERMTLKNGEIFEIKDEARTKQILAASFNGNPVAELVKNPQDAIMQDNNMQDANNNNNAVNNNDGENDSANISLEDMTVKELKELAIQKGIELTATKKEDIINEIQTSLKVNDSNDNINKEDSDK